MPIYYDGFIPWITEGLKTLYRKVVGLEDEQRRQVTSSSLLALYLRVMVFKLWPPKFSTFAFAINIGQVVLPSS